MPSASGILQKHTHRRYLTPLLPIESYETWKRPHHVLITVCEIVIILLKCVKEEHGTLLQENTYVYVPHVFYQTVFFFFFQ